MATVTADDALAELKARGVDPKNPQTPSTGQLSKEEAMAELQRRGVSVPQAPSSLPSYATPAQQQQNPISSMIAKGLGVGLEGLNAPFQAIGEPIRRAITQAQGTNPGPYRAPTVIQRGASLIPALQGLIPQTKEQAPDMFSAVVNPAMAGYKGIAATVQNLPQGVGQALQAGNQAVNQKPGLPEAVTSTAAAIGSGEAGAIPFTVAMKPFTVLGKLLETGEMAGVPGIGAAAKSITGTDAVPLGLENLTAHANPEVLEAAKKFNVPATAGMLTGSPTLNAIESFGKKLPFSSNIFQQRFGDIYDSLKNIQGPMVESTKAPAELGLDVQGGLSTASQSAYGKAQALYANAEKAIPPNTKIALDPLQAKAAELLKAQGKLPKGAQAQGAVGLLQDLTDQRSQFMDYPTVQSLRSELNSRIAQANAALGSASPGAKFQSSPEARIYSQLQDALDTSMTKFSDATGGAFKSAFSEATKTYQNFKQTFKDDKFLQSLLSEQNPENVVNKIIKAVPNNPRALGTLKLNLPSQTLNDLQTSFIKDMSEKDPNVFNPSYFASQYDSIGEKKLTDILGPQKMAELRPLYALSRAGVNAERSGQMASGPSGAGVGSSMMLRQPIQAAITGAAAGKLFGGSLKAAALGGAMMEGLPLLAKGYLSNPATKFLSRQVGMTPSFPAAGAAAQTVAKTSLPIQTLIDQLKAKYDTRRKM